MARERGKQVKLNFPNDNRGYYVPSDFSEKMTLQELKNEYTRLRDIARKRVNRIDEKKLLPGKFIKEYRDMFPTIAELMGSVKQKSAEKIASEDLRKSTQTASELGKMLGLISSPANNHFTNDPERIAIIKALCSVSRLLNVKDSTIPKARVMRDKFRADMQRQLDRWGIPPESQKLIDPFMFWEFVESMGSMAKDLLFYNKNKGELHFMFNTRDMINKINSGKFSEVLDQIQKARADAERRNK